MYIKNKEMIFISLSIIVLVYVQYEITRDIKDMKIKISRHSNSFNYNIQ